jgi:hypothetical protein
MNSKNGEREKGIRISESTTNAFGAKVVPPNGSVEVKLSVPLAYTC